MNENEYLELTNQLKLKFDENEKKTKKAIQDYNELYKVTTMCYGLIRTFIENNENYTIYDIFLAEAREYLSMATFKHLQDIDSDDE
tara:strand:+ start:350 stop:607 length:258 start_codon:yes stop_codon:yes gene_type:complete